MAIKRITLLSFMLAFHAALNGGPSLGRLPLSFEPNQGQSPPQVRFLARGSGYAVALTSQGVQVKFQTADAESRHPQTPRTSPEFRLQFLGANSKTVLSGLKPLPGKSHYLLGRDPGRWLSGVLHYGRVRYQNLYPGIDLLVYGQPGRLQYDFQVAAGADPTVIEMEFEGVDGLTLDEEGKLRLRLPGQEIVQLPPVLYQESDGAEEVVTGSYKLCGARRVGFQVGPYDRRRPLVIDPILTFSILLGAGTGNAIALDASGNIYVAGTTSSTLFPTVNPVRGSNTGKSDVFISKLDPTGSTLVYSTYVGGSEDDFALALAVDAEGNVHVVGSTRSTDFPTANAFQGRKGDNNNSLRDAFVVKLARAGSAFLYATYLGGSGDDFATAIAIDSTGSSYITGRAGSADFPTVNAFQARLGNPFGNAFVAKFEPQGRTLIYSTYLGGNGGDQGDAIAVDRSGNALVAGLTGSTDFPTQNAFQATKGGQFYVIDAFVTKLNSTGSGLVYSTYFGGSVDEAAQGIAVDSTGNAYVTGWTRSDDFPLVKPLRSECGCGGGAFRDAFIAKLNDTGAVQFSTFLGGERKDTANGIAIDVSGNIYVVGETNSVNFPTVNPLQAGFGGGNCVRLSGLLNFSEPCDDIFLAKLNVEGSRLIYSSYLGGDRDDRGKAIALDSVGNAYLTGFANSSTFPVTQRLQMTTEGVFVAKVVEGTTLFFAQFGDGAQTGASLSSQITVVNLDTFSPAQVIVQLNDDAGNPLSVDLNGVLVAGRTEAVVAAGGAVSLKTDGGGPLQTGSVVVSSDRPIAGYILYQASRGMAGVGASPALKQLVAPVQTGAGINSGVAMMGLGAAQVIELELRDAQGKRVARARQSLTASGHVARFVTEFAWDTPVDFSGFSGTLVATGVTEFAATAILVTANEYATLPVAIKE